jgi:hypothetical protein
MEVFVDTVHRNNPVTVLTCILLASEHMIMQNGQKMDYLPRDARCSTKHWVLVTFRWLNDGVALHCTIVDGEN